MKEMIVDGAEAGIRLDKFLEKLLPYAGRAFLYKMLRKKNITLNGKKAEGSERLRAQDHIYIFFSDETYEQFRHGQNRSGQNHASEDQQRPVMRSLSGHGRSMDKGNAAGLKAKAMQVPFFFVYGYLVVDYKPAVIWKQRAAKYYNTLNDWLCAYLAERQMKSPDRKEERLSYTPSAVNRLDRNTSGLVLCARTYQAARVLSRMIRDRAIGKYYLVLVRGTVAKSQELKGFLKKDIAHNKVKITENGAGDEIHTAYTPLLYLDRHDMTLLSVQLITGKSHQIRAHLAGCSHPVCGDPKYGDARVNKELSAKYGIHRQLLHAFALSFPENAAWDEGRRMPLAGKTVVAPPPQDFRKLLHSYPTGETIWQRGIQEDFAVPPLKI